ncbi:hypothetical protein HM1_2553 [Heliomicrobium modesticaldum Ice1]|uniref:Uncharacterized protein n=1 Tax=Heliobacterium modesticaldum (strain ATCC 51547 / Ice1) TaxID=498761 RepID=B0TAX9_HELMI|nr:hypothetical protein HM1_2553 [Heliomicrobium modesticaldum Ice1]
MPGAPSGNQGLTPWFLTLHSLDETPLLNAQRCFRTADSMIE